MAPAVVEIVRQYGRPAATALVGGVVLVVTWLYRFNDPGGSFAGLTDDHFFYLVRGWQLLYGDLPVRDFVDHGAPLFYYVGAAVQRWLGRGTVSEITFCVTVLSLSATLTFWLAARASGSILIGLAGTLVHVLLEPRFYNYPKILVYAVAIPLLWRFADRQDVWTRVWLAVATVGAFLLRHDHGAFVAIAVATMLLMLREVSWRAKVRHALLYGGMVLAILSPYLLFIQVNGGLTQYFRDASAWAARDRLRAPVVWPGLFDNPQGVSEAARSAEWLVRTTAVVRDNAVAWIFYLELALPFLAIAWLAASRDGFRSAWPRAVPKIATVAVLGIVLNAGFLRSPLSARLADPSVPLVILIAWLAAAFLVLCRSRMSLRPGLVAWATPVRAAAGLTLLPVIVLLVAVFSADFYERLDRTGFVERPGKPFDRVEDIRRQVATDWQLASWATREDRPDLITLSLYLNACTSPRDRVFVQGYMPQVVALAQRAFAGGHADLRPGFFTSDAAQRLTLSRLEQQSVPVLLLEDADDYQNFRKSFPLIVDYFDENYTLAATHTLDGRFGIQLFARNDLISRGKFAPLDWPCFR